MREIKKYFWIIGTLSISLVILLFVLCQIGVNYNQSESISVLNLNREKRSVNFMQNENIDEIQRFWSQISDRKRRNIDIDQNDLRMFEVEFIRRKRLFTDMRDIEDKFKNCKKFQKDDRCERFFQDIIQINKLLQENVVLMDEIRKKYDKIEENKMRQVVHTRPVAIHEDLDRTNNLWNNDKFKFSDALHNEQKHMLPPAPSLREFREKSDDKVITPLSKNPNFGNVLMCNGIFLVKVFGVTFKIN